jgi:ABC-type transport system involved in multi-copper enzyme maturation permease subunit
MSSTVASTLDWLKRTVPWSNTRQAWQERMGLLLTLVAAVALAFHGDALPGWAQAASWAGLALAVAYLLRRGWIRLFGPVLFYDLVRSARRTRAYVVRTAYLVCLLIGLSLLYLNYDPGRFYRGTASRGPLRSNEAAQFAEAFFGTFMLVQFGLVVLLTPGYTAGAIAEEKERKTLEFLLATDLRNREIVLGKLTSRMAHLTLLVLGGLPVLSAVQFMGGVDPNLLLAGFAATAVTMLSLSALGILCSVLARRGREAILMAYLAVFGYVVLCGAGSLVTNLTSWGRLPSTATWDSPYTLSDAIEFLQSGHPIYALIRIFNPRAGVVVSSIPDTLRDYAIFHAIVAGVCLAWALARLRTAALREPARKAGRLKVRGVGRRVGNAPMVWKEVFAERGFRLHWTARGILGLFVAGSFIPAVIAYERYFTLREEVWLNNYGYGEYLARGLNEWVRLIGTAVAFLGHVAVAVRAAGGVRGERDRDTFDSLLTTPLSSREILFGKWLGSVLSVRRWAVWLGLIWLVAVLGGGLSPFAVPLLLGVWLVYAGVLAALGLWWSVVARSSARATMGTLSCGLAMGVGHWFPWLCCMPFIIRGPGRLDFLEWIAKFQAGATPPVVLGLMLPFQNSDFRFYDSYTHNRAWEYLFFAFLGTAVWVVAGGLLWRAAQARFQQAFHRGDVTLPDALSADRALRSRVCTLVVEDAPDSSTEEIQERDKKSL